MSPVGIGYDSHRFAAGRRLVLGGVEIEHDRGLEGHSDADVLTHAVIDALLGAGGLGTSARSSRMTRSDGGTPTRSTCCERLSAKSRGGSSTSTSPSSARSRGWAPAAARWSGSSPRPPRLGSASRRAATRVWAGSAAARGSPRSRWPRSAANKQRRAGNRLRRHGPRHDHQPRPQPLEHARRRRLPGQGPDRGGDNRADPAGQDGADRRHLRPLGSHTRHRRRRHGDPPSR